MTAVFPATIPIPRQRAASAAVELLFSGDEMNAGYATYTRRADNLPVTIPVEWVLTGVQLRDLMKFTRDHAGKRFQITIERLSPAGLASYYATMSDIDIEPVSDAYAIARATLMMQSI